MWQVNLLLFLTIFKKGFLNDLWYYDVENEMWAWIAGSEQYNQKGIYDNKGSPTVSGVPGGRSNAVGWFDELSQEFWLFGGQGFGGTTEEVGVHFFFFFG